jgi:S1-C subfamily serine protease
MKRIEPRNPKDVWDKLGVIASLISSVVIASVGLILTVYYQRNEATNRRLEQEQQARQEDQRSQISKVELVTKLLPDLRSKDYDTRRQALLAVKALGDTKLMVALALSDSGPAAQAALLVVSRSPETNSADQEIAHRALTRIELSRSVVQIRSSTPSGGEKLATGFIWHQPNLVVTCLHSVLGAHQVTAIGADVRRELVVSKVVAHADLVLLQSSEAFPLQPIPESITKPAEDDAVFVLGYPLGIRTPLSSTVHVDPSARMLRDLLPANIASEINKIGIPDLSMGVLKIDGNLALGESGAPLVNAKGEVIAVMNGGLRELSIAWGIPATQLRALLNSTEKLPDVQESSLLF